MDKATAEQVRDAVALKFAPYVSVMETRPTLVEGYDWSDHAEPAPYAVVWEEGPYEWALQPLGEETPDEELTGILQTDFGYTRKLHNPAVTLPAGVHLEPVHSYALAVYPS